MASSTENDPRKLTVPALNALIKKARAELTDGKKQSQLKLVKNFYLLIGKDTALFFLRYTEKGHKIYKKIGLYPDTSLAQARAALSGIYRRQEQAEEQKDGICPLLKNFYPEFLKAYFKSGHNSKRYSNLKSAWKWLSPLGGLRLDEIRPKNIIGEISKAKVKQNYKNAVFQALKQCLDYAVMLEEIELNPARSIASSRLNPLRRERSEGYKWLQADQLKTGLFSKIGDIALIYKTLILYTALSCARIGEARYLRWDFIDLKKRLITIPAEMMKNGREHTVAMTSQITALLQNWREIITQQCDSPLVFPSARNPAEPCSYTSLTVIIKNATAGLMSMHGLRKTASTWMHEKDFAFAAELCLAHQTGSETERVYNYAGYFEQKMKCLQAWDDFVEQNCLTEDYLQLIRN